MAPATSRRDGPRVSGRGRNVADRRKRRGRRVPRLLSWSSLPARIALTLLFFASFFHNLPEPVLGAIVLMAASHLVQFKDLRQLRFVSRIEIRVSMLAFAGVLGFGLLDGLLLAAARSLVVLMAQASRPLAPSLDTNPPRGASSVASDIPKPAMCPVRWFCAVPGHGSISMRAYPRQGPRAGKCCA